MTEHEPDCIHLIPRPESAGDWDGFLGTGDWDIWSEWVGELATGENVYRLAERIAAEVWPTVWLPCGCPEEQAIIGSRLEDAIVRELESWRDHVHDWGPVEHARMTGNPHRKCRSCPVVTLDLDDDE